MAVLIIGEPQRAAIAELIAYAAATPLDPQSMIAASAADEAGFRDMMRTFSIEIPIGYHVTFSHERQPIGVCRHISISHEPTGAVPAPAAVIALMDAFGMDPPKKSLSAWVEDLPDGCAINFLQHAPIVQTTKG